MQLLNHSAALLGSSSSATTPNDDLARDIGTVFKSYQSRELNAACLSASYLLLWQLARYGRQSAARRERSAPAPDVNGWRRDILQNTGQTLETSLRHQLTRYHQYKVPGCAIAALLNWLDGDPRAQLQTRIPSPRMVLDLQCAGYRPVTLVVDFPRALEPILGKSDGLAFLLHDLEHLAKFIQDPKTHAQQVGFFRAIRQALSAGALDQDAEDPIFGAAFDYLISDMNTHPIHALRYLRAILIDRERRREPLAPESTRDARITDRVVAAFEALAESWRLGPRDRAALLGIGHGRLCATAAQRLTSWFEAGVANNSPLGAPFGLESGAPDGSPSPH